MVTGPSGAGKGTMVEALLARVPTLRLAISATTRPRRPSEADGEHYWFLTDAQFDERLDAGDFLEYHVFPWGQRSGTLRSELDRIAASGGVPLLELELNGSLAVKQAMPAAIAIFVDAPLAELERRLLERATESSGEIDKRIAYAREQKQLAGQFDYVVENDDRERAPPTSASRSWQREFLAGAATMAPQMIHPRIDELLAKVDSRYALVIVAAKRTRQINNYHHQLGEGTFDEFAPPLVESRSKNYLTLALEEVSEGKITYDYRK